MAAIFASDPCNVYQPIYIPVVSLHSNVAERTFILANVSIYRAKCAMHDCKIHETGIDEI